MTAPRTPPPEEGPPLQGQWSPAQSPCPSLPDLVVLGEGSEQTTEGAHGTGLGLGSWASAPEHRWEELFYSVQQNKNVQ